MLYPFARDKLTELIASYPNLKEIAWVQEEPANQGAWPTFGLGLGIGAALIDYRSLRAYAPFIYGLSCLGLVAVLSPLGSTR